MEKSPFRIVQISDIHLFGDKNNALLGVNTLESFEALFNLLKADNLNPNMILLSGDLSQDGSKESYIRIADIVNSLNIPIYCVPGNHDDSDMMARVFPRGFVSMQKQIVIDGWQLILLDSHIPRKVEGYLNENEFDFLENCLKMYPNHHAIVVFHHHPIPVGCEWLDKIGLTNAAKFWEFLIPFQQVNFILFGHVHQLHEGEKQNIKYYSTPSTCIQFKTKSSNFALDELPPAYRLIDLFPNGQLKTHVKRMSYYVGQFQKDAKGY